MSRLALLLPVALSLAGCRTVAQLPTAAADCAAHAVARHMASETPRRPANVPPGTLHTWLDGARAADGSVSYRIVETRGPDDSGATDVHMALDGAGSVWLLVRAESGGCTLLRALRPDG